MMCVRNVTVAPKFFADDRELGSKHPSGVPGHTIQDSGRAFFILSVAFRHTGLGRVPLEIVTYG